MGWGSGSFNTCYDLCQKPPCSFPEPWTGLTKPVRAGRVCNECRVLEVARDVALEAIGHVTLEDPRLHFLLGQLALGLSDRVLLREARAHMAFFRQDMWEQRLDRSVRSGSPEFPDFEQIAGSR